MHDPFAMRPFFGYNFGHYLQHWLDFGDESKRGQLKLPKIFHVNWFRKNSSGKFIWPGFGENARVIDWIFRRCDGDEQIFNETPIGKVPKSDSIRLDGLKVKTQIPFWFQSSFYSIKLVRCKLSVLQCFGRLFPHFLVQLNPPNSYC